MSEVTIEPAAKQHGPAVDVRLNNRWVRLPNHRVTGLEIKQAAIGAGVQIELPSSSPRNCPAIAPASSATPTSASQQALPVHRCCGRRQLLNDDDEPRGGRGHREDSERPCSRARSTVREDGEGGAFVIVEGVDPGPLYEQPDTWIGFRITFQYPYSDVYPHYVRGTWRAPTSGRLGEGPARSTFEGRPAVQLSRRSNHLNPVTDTAVHQTAEGGSHGYARAHEPMELVIPGEMMRELEPASLSRRRRRARRGHRGRHDLDPSWRSVCWRGNSSSLTTGRTTVPALVDTGCSARRSSATGSGVRRRTAGLSGRPLPRRQRRRRVLRH